MEFQAVRNKYNTKEWLFALFLVFIPFSQALTLNIGFPLKLSEIFIVFLFGFLLINQEVFKLKLNKGVTISLLTFIGLITI